MSNKLEPVLLSDTVSEVEFINWHAKRIYLFLKSHFKSRPLVDLELVPERADNNEALLVRSVSIEEYVFQSKALTGFVVSRVFA